MNFKITTLVENTVAQSGKALLGEHGLSFYVEAGDHKILFLVSLRGLSLRQAGRPWARGRTACSK